MGISLNGYCCCDKSWHHAISHLCLHLPNPSLPKSELLNAPFPNPSFLMVHWLFNINKVIGSLIYP